jgi:phage tail-like protein
MAVTNVMDLGAGTAGQLGFQFGVELHGKPLAGVVDVSGLSVEITAVEQKAVTQRGLPYDRKIPGKSVAPGELTVKLATPPGGPLEKAHWASVTTGAPLQIGDALVTLYGPGGKPALKWQFGMVFIKDLSWSDLGAGDAQLATLSLTLQYNTAKVLR